jgi:glutaminyl-peptide cyclotransferase
MTCSSRSPAPAATASLPAAPRPDTRRWLACATIALTTVLAACQKPTTPGATSPTTSAPLDALPAYDPTTSLHLQVSGEKILAWAHAVTAMGARPAGSEAIEKTRQYLETELKNLGWVTQRQTFEDTTPRGRITFANLRARFAGGPGDPWQRAVPLIIASHYDTKFYTEFVFVGANDGASGNAVQLELARILATSPAVAQRVELVFFDGEEASVEYTPLDGLHGSRHYARAWREWPRDQRPRRGLLLDMVGEKDLKIEMPANQSSDALRRLALRAAADAGHARYFGLSSQEILDDHVPLGMAGLEMVNFIDLNYRVWHTAEDTADQLSAESLAISGQVALLFTEKYLLR